MKYTFLSTKLFLFLGTTIILASSLSAQVSGTIVDKQDKALPGASAVLYRSNDSKGGASAGVDGKFSIPASSGKYTLEVSFISFQKYTQEIVVPQSGKLDVGTIKLQSATTGLDEVTVEAEANMMEFKQDKRVFNVGKDLSNAAANASEILDNLPSVTVGVEGDVSLRGSQNVRILVNGKPSGLIGNDPANALRQLQGNIIERIEVITNPSARYDAEGEAGIINIVLKKEREAGINGSFNIQGGYPELYGAGASVNYRKNKLNLFTNLSFNYNKAPGGGYSKQSFNLEDTSYYFRRDRDQLRGGLDATLRFGADYNITDNQTLTGSFLYSPSDDENEVNIRYQDFDSADNLQQVVRRNDLENETERTLEGNLSWVKDYEDFDDHKWTADFTYTQEREREQSRIIQDTLDRAGELEQKVDNLERQKRIFLQTDYVHPFSEDESYELGTRATLRTINTDFSLEDRIGDGSLVEDPRFTNVFGFTENVYAAYGIYNGAWGDDFTYQLGLRAESTELITELDSIGENRRTFLNLFPSTFLTYSLNSLSDIQLSYSRRINRPGFWTLNPFFSFSDNRNFYSGNPNVNPEFTDSYEAGFLRYLENGSVYGGVYYRHRTGVVERIRTVDSTGFTRIFPVNLATQDNWGLELNLQWKPTEWYRMNANVNFYRSVTEGDYEGTSYDAETQTASGRINNTLSFWNSDLQISFRFRAPANTTQGRRLGIYTMNLGWSRDFLDKKATVTFSVRDLFNTRFRRSYTFGNNFSSFSRFQWRQRQATITLKYRLDQSSQKKKPSRGGPPAGGGDYGAP